MEENIFIPRSDNDDGKPINKELLNFQLKAIIGRLDKIDSKLEGNEARYASVKDHKELEDRVKELEATRSKIAWLIVTAVIIAILGTVLVTTK